MKHRITPLLFLASCLICVTSLNAKGIQLKQLGIEVLQVGELPLTAHQTMLVHSEKGHFIKCSLSNSSESKILGLRYSLVIIESTNKIRVVANRNEGLSLSPYATKSFKFSVPPGTSVNDGARLVLMLEQVISQDTIWEVMKAREALDAYARGDYSVVPVVSRSPNHVDAPGPSRVIYKKN